MPKIDLSERDLALIRKALRRMAQRHRSDPEGDRYDHVCGLIDDQLAENPMGPGFIADWSSVPTIGGGAVTTAEAEEAILSSPFSRMETFPQARASRKAPAVPAQRQVKTPAVSRRKKPAAAPTGSKVQSLVFSRVEFSRAAAVLWAREHGFKAGKVESTKNTWRIRQLDPKLFARMRTISFRPGVKAVVGWQE